MTTEEDLTFDEDRIEEIFDKMVEEGLKVCPLIILEADIKEGVPIRRPEPSPLWTWIVACNRDVFKVNSPELEILQKEDEDNED